MLPEKDYYRIERLSKEWANKWNCELSAQDIVDYAAAGRLQLHFWFIGDVQLAGSGKRIYIRATAPLPQEGAKEIASKGSCQKIENILLSLDNGDSVESKPTNPIIITIEDLVVLATEKVQFENQSVQQDAAVAPKTKSAYLRTIAALTRALTGQEDLTQPYKVAETALQALAAKNIEAPITKETMAKYLSEAED